MGAALHTLPPATALSHNLPRVSGSWGCHRCALELSSRLSSCETAVGEASFPQAMMEAHRIGTLGSLTPEGGGTSVSLGFLEPILWLFS